MSTVKPSLFVGRASGDEIRLEKASPSDLALAFCRMDSHEQAHFFFGVAAESGCWEKNRVFQWQHVIDSPNWTAAAAKLWREFGEYGAPRRTVAVYLACCLCSGGPNDAHGAEACPVKCACHTSHDAGTSVTYEMKDKPAPSIDVEAVRRTALLDAAKDVCMYCGGRADPTRPAVHVARGPNAAGNYVHRFSESGGVESLCAATPIHARLKWEARPKAEGEVFA